MVKYYNAPQHLALAGPPVAAGAPQIHIHFEDRPIHGRGVAHVVYGELKIAAKEYVYAAELNLKCIQTLHLTTMTGTHTLLHPQFWIFPDKLTYNNMASIDIFNDLGAEILCGMGPSEGSVWLNFIAVGD